MTLTELADSVGVAKSTLSRYKNTERDFPINDIGKYANVLDTTVEYLLGFDSSPSKERKYKYFPAYVSAGLPNDVEAVTEHETISIADEIMGKYAGSKNIYFIKINGESMNKIIPHDSLIAVRPVSSIHDLKTGDIVVYRKDGEYAVKRLVIDKDKWIFKPESTDDRFYDDVIYKDADVKIKGKAVLYIVEV